MAKRKDPVRTNMVGGFPKVGVSGPKGVTEGRNKAPFDAPQSMGGGGVPTVFFVNVGEKVAARFTPTQTAGANTRPPREGAVQSRYGRNST
jgi:hypothetical protein